MAKSKEIKTNAMRILDSMKIQYETVTYQCEQFTDGKQIADLLGQPYELMYKTLVTIGASHNYYVFVIPVDKELDLKKSARCVNEKSIAMLPVKDINKITGYIRGGCTAIGMKKQYDTTVDSSAQGLERMIISGGKLGAQIILAPDDLIKASSGKFCDVVFD